MIDIIALTKQNTLETGLTMEDLQEGNYEWYWIDFNSPVDSEIEYLREPLQFHPLSIEDCLHNLQRPKIDYFDEYTFLVTHSLEAKTYAKEELNLFIGDNYIVSFHKEPSIEVQFVAKKLLGEKKPAKWSQFTVLYELLDRLVDNYIPIIYEIEDFLNEIDENPENKSMEVLLDDLYETRHRLLSVRHTVVPMRDLLYTLLNTKRLTAVSNKREYYSDIYDHLLKLAEVIESNREMTADIRDSYLSYNAHQSNRIMQILTVITTIFMPLSFLAGLYGMNFRYMPELNWKYGYFSLLGTMVLIACCMFLYFKRKGWFK
ncbi:MULTISPECIES: magnesium/cobalt transporter CorA [Bacillaceae]|uniref:magnesium/cobalt transporter CorA n=1 Tax=Bacillaceae TaxID=186817 RepID=UPI001E4C266D|nr:MULTISPECIES: magnesium/cobalt transporter CorA [Bacillaceae]MCE4051101.1 magnesium/cobalt transporter CorA [Bacillus sp. Au-Bac7]MCM3030294.1 magnesium/cobalt transporter CorA [Niallia sp. MER 6]MDL0436825.1 magnesium/cobalt transporter CorA [Niallia sp. SS-2023]UPO88264.1 magnesium/cobalt transporter CorA [Niallia sp. Man26]